MKKIFGCIALLVLLVCGFTISATAETPIIGISCPESVMTGDTFDVYVTVTEDSGICGGRITLNYDTNVVEVISASSEPLLKGTTFFSNLNASERTVKVTWAGVNGISAGGNLFKITFKAKKIYSDSFTSVYFSEVKVTDTDTNVINVTAVSGSTVVNGIAKPEFSIVANEEALSGDLFDVSVNLSDNSLACGGRFSLCYDNTMFAVETATLGDALTGVFAFVNSTADGIINVTFAGVSPIVGKELLHVTFRTVGDILSETEFSVEKFRLEDVNGDNIECEVSDAKTLIVEELICKTITTSNIRDGKIYFDTRVKNCFEDSVVAVALYKEGILQDVSAATVNGKMAQNILNNCNFDNARIMLWDSVSNMRPLIDVVNTSEASENLLNQLPDFSCDVIVDANGVLSNNNPTLPEKIDNCEINWSINGSDNFAIVDNCIAVVDNRDLKDMTLTLTANVQALECAPTANRSFIVDVQPLYLEQEHVVLNETGFSEKLKRGDSFLFEAEIPLVNVNGFNTSVKPIYDAPRYSFSSVDADGNPIDYRNVFMADDKKYTILEDALIGSVNTVRTDVGYTVNGEFVTVYTAERVFTVEGRTYTIVFESNGGSIVSNGKEVDSFDVVEESGLPTNISVNRVGYKHIGWYTYDGTYIESDDAFIMPSKNCSLTPAWEPENYILSLDCNYDGGPYDSVTVTYDANYAIDFIPDRVGYAFDGWYTHADGGEKITEETVVKTAENHTVYAHWTPCTYTVDFDANSGECVNNKKVVTYDNTYGELPDAHKEGYNFDGWYTKADAGEEITAETVVTTSENHTLYAHWTPCTYIVSFDAVGGDTSTTSKQVTMQTVYGTLPIPARDYHYFDGWFTSPDGGIQITESSVLITPHDHTLYAHWTLKEVNEWVTADKVPEDAQIVETKWQYTLREYTENNNGSFLDGWTHYDTLHTSWTSWSNWSTTNPTNGVRDVDKRSVFDHYQYHYYRWTNSSYTAIYSYKTSSYNCTTLEETWFDYELPVSIKGDPVRYNGSDDRWANRWIRANYSANYSTSTDFTREVYRDEWRYRDPIYTYYFYKDSNHEAYEDPNGRNNVFNIVKLCKYRVK